MMRNVLCTSILLCSSAWAASPAAIGIITASGHFTVEGSRIWGNATLFDGARVETGTASSEVSLRNGVKVQLGAGSSARIWANHLNLEQGSGQVTAPGKFEIGAGEMNVSTSGSRLLIAVAATERLQVAALSGTARVTGARGTLLGSVAAGGTSNFASFAMMQALTRAGCLLYKDGGFLLKVDDSPEVLQLQGPDLVANVGNRVEITGSRATTAATVAPASGVLDVSSVAPRSVGGCLTVAATLNAQTSIPQNPTTAGAKPPAPAAKGAEAPAKVAKTGGMSTGKKAAIIIAVAGGGGAAAAIALSSKKSSTSP